MVAVVWSPMEKFQNEPESPRVTVRGWKPEDLQMSASAVIGPKSRGRMFEPYFA